jgi:hypothetical protein
MIAFDRFLARLFQEQPDKWVVKGGLALQLQMPAPPKNWERPFQRIANEVRLEYTSLKEADAAMKRFLNPVLNSEAAGVWVPLRWNWR